MRSKCDIKRLTEGSVSKPMKTPKTKFEVSPPKNVVDTFQVKTTPEQQIFPEGLTKILLGVPMNPIFNFFERADIELSESIYFYPL